MVSDWLYTDLFIPVITIVIYYGEKKWDGAKSLHEMLDIPNEMKPFVNDYKMHLVEARENNLTFHNTNNADLFHLLQIIFDQSLSKNEAKQKAIEYSATHHTANSIIMTVAGATNSKLEGRVEEIVKSRLLYNASANDILNRLQSELNISYEKALEYLDTYRN